MIITAGIFEAAERTPDKLAIVCGRETLTYAATARAISAYAPRLSGLEKIAILLRNEPTALAVFFAAVRGGATAMVFDPNWPSDLRKRVVAAHRPALVIDGETDVPTLAGQVVLPAPDRQFLMGFTSGTTGLPKAFVRTHASWRASFDAASQEFGGHAAGGVLAPGPLCHSLTLYAAVETLEAGGTIHLQPTFDAKACLRLIASGTVQSLHCVPSMLDLLCAEVSVAVTRPFAIVCAGAKLSTGLRAAIRERLPGAQVYEYYGASELSFVTLAHPADNPPPESVGRAFRSVRLAVRRDDGADTATGEVGTVWVQSPMISDGYVGPTDGSGFRTANGWATVGDRGALDKDGFLTLVGRENDMLISGGLNVYPQEIEAILAAVAGVRGVAVLGIPDVRWGQVVTAVIEGDVRRDVLMQACGEHLPRGKWPRRWYKIAAMPRTTSGKIARAKLAELLPELPELP